MRRLLAALPLLMVGLQSDPYGESIVIEVPRPRYRPEDPRAVAERQAREKAQREAARVQAVADAKDRWAKRKARKASKRRPS